MSGEENTKLVELISAAELSSELGISEGTLLKWVRLGVFPAPFRVGLRKMVWLKKSVNEHLLALESESKNEEVK